MYSIGMRGLHGRHSRSFGIITSPGAASPGEAIKNPLDPATSNAYAQQAAQQAAAGERAVNVELVQRAMLVHFGAQAMRHSCGATGCDGRWGPGTERLLDQVFELLGFGEEVTFAVKGDQVLLPGPVAAWVITKAGEYRTHATSSSVTIPTPTLEEALVPEGAEEPYTSPRRRSGATTWLIVGGVTAAVGVGALGFVLWKKKRR